MRIYQKVAEDAPNPVGRRTVIPYLNRVLPDIFASQYPSKGTMGGGTDINLFPQVASVNRGGEWRRMERYAAENPGTFCFIRPIYKGTSWTRSSLEYGIYMLPPDAFRFWGNVFPN